MSTVVVSVLFLPWLDKGGCSAEDGKDRAWESGEEEVLPSTTEVDNEEMLGGEIAAMSGARS